MTPPATIKRCCCSICGAEVRRNTWSCEHVYIDPVPRAPHRITTTRVLEYEYRLVEGSERVVQQEGETDT